MYVIMCYINEVLIARVILGHHFTFADSALHVQNVDYVAQVRSKHVGGLLFEAVAQGEYSVDTFLFIGATLLSYLLLKAEWSTLIGRGMSRLVSHWTRAS